MKTFATFFLLVSFLSNLSSQKITKVNQIIDQCIEAHGGAAYESAHYSYDFRKYHYVFHYDQGVYKYERHDKTIDRVDRLTNDGFERWEKGQLVDLPDKEARKYANSVNSVHYFSFLPFFLNDPAVNKRLLGETTINGVDYYEIEVTFEQTGGGDDFEDVYIYWINQEDFTLDYLAYSFHVNGGGVRFRSAYNRREVDGIIFQDYVNFKHDKTTPVHLLDDLFVKNQLTELSRIELSNIRSL